MPYFLIRNKHGLPHVEVYDGEGFLVRLERGDYGLAPGFLPDIPEIDIGRWNDAMLLIKGEIVVPTEEEVVVYKLD